MTKLIIDEEILCIGGLNDGRRFRRIPDNARSEPLPRISLYAQEELPIFKSVAKEITFRVETYRLEKIAGKDTAIYVYVHDKMTGDDVIRHLIDKYPKPLYRIA